MSASRLRLLRFNYLPRSHLGFSKNYHQPQKRRFHKDRYSPYAFGLTGPATNRRDVFEVVTPATGEHLSTIEAATSDDVQNAIAYARKLPAHVWSTAPIQQRSNTLSKLANALQARIADFARLEALQTGRTLREMNAQLGRLPEWLHYYAALIRTVEGFVAPTQGKLLNYVQRAPLGIVAQITPFNHPLLIAVKKIAPALAAGNRVVVKPSELAPISVLEFARMATEEAGLPQGVLSVLPGLGPVTAKEIISNQFIRKVDITAGTETGRAVGSIVGPNLASFTAELGGKAPIVVFNDADLTSAVNGAAFAAFVASGQTCVSGTRLILQDGVYDAFMDGFLQKVRSITERMGNPMNPKSTMGSVISSRHLARIEAAIEGRERGTILAGGERMSGTSSLDDFDFTRGSFLPPTVVEGVDVGDKLWEEEVFGPVVVVKRFKDEEEGISLANASKYGLGAGIWTSDVGRAHRVAAEIEAGLVWVNTHHRNDPSSPWGGMKQSGIGRENGVEALMSYSQSKSTIVNIASAEETRSNDDWFADDTAGKRYG